MPGFYITTPIYYVNARPHIGHAYSTIMADVLARHHRQRGESVFFLTGTDEHGVNVARAAAAAGRTPREHADLNSASFRQMGETLGASNDFFIRTTDPEHEAEAQRFLDALHAAGDLYRGSYGGWYCTACEAYYAEEKLLEGRLCPIHRRPVELVEEENWFFRLSAYRERLLAHYDAHPGFVVPAARANEARRMIAEIEDLSFTRAQVEWGVPVPFAPGQTVYVWVEALLNYRTALTYARPGHDLTARFWPPDVHLMAKDILRFHAVVWPAMLMAAGLPLPRRLAVHGYVLKGGEKMSKTVGNVIDPMPFIARYGLDALRYYLAREIRFGEDGSFSAEGFDARYHGELANELGNLLSRVVSMTTRYREGVVPADPGGDGALAGEVAATVDAVIAAMDALDITRAVEAAWGLVRRLNRLVEERAPWTLAKDPERAGALDQALASLAEGLRVVALLVAPVMPESAARILTGLGQPHDDLSLARAAWGAGAPGARVSPVGQLFPRVEPEPAGAAAEAAA